MPFFLEKNNKILLRLHIQAGARASEIQGLHDNRLKMRIQEPAQDNRANQAIISFFSKNLKIPKSEIKIIKGLKTNKKTLEINLSKEAFLQKAKLSGFLPL